MRILISLLILSTLLAGSAWAGEPAAPEAGKTEGPQPLESAVPKMDAKVKAERIEKVTADIAKWEKMIASHSPESIANTRKINPARAEAKLAEKARLEKAIPVARIEIRWLKGELTPEGTEKALKTAEEALAKAEKDKSPLEAPRAALEKATFERDEVKRLEEAERPKDKEPEA